MRRRLGWLLGAFAVVLLAGLWLAHSVSWGLLGEHQRPGEPSARRVPWNVIAERQILFGDLHAHTTFSTDAFAMSLPLMGGGGTHPPADACDFARFCASLDFWSINDHAENLTPRHWAETRESIRRCNAAAGDPANPDTVAFLGWEWTQVGPTRDTHYGHKNVILLRTDDAHVPARPIAAGVALQVGSANPFGPGPALLALLDRDSPVQRYFDFARHMAELADVRRCDDDANTADLPDDCMEVAETPEVLFRKLREWGGESLVIPHGTTWGFYTPAGSTWDKQRVARQQDPQRQRLFEIYSGHGGAEEYRSWRAVEAGAAAGEDACPMPTPDYLPSCWRAGEIVRDRCREARLPGDECQSRARVARERYVAAGQRGFRVVPGATVEDWRDAGQCRDCFLPAFNYRPGGSAQYATAAGARFGFVAASDGHKARPGTGYKEVARTKMVDGLRFVSEEAKLRLLRQPDGDPKATESVALDDAGSGGFGRFEMERTASFMVSGGLTGVHAEGRSREAIWDALQRREVYATSGPRILLWFDLLDAPRDARGLRRDGSVPMGAEVSLARNPRFRVAAVGSFEQRPGCPAFAESALGPEGLVRLCANECYHPSDERRLVTRIEVVRIRPRTRPGEPVDALVQDPWRTFECPPDPAGCRVEFTDDDFVEGARDAVYYARAVEAPGLAINADNLRCWRDAAGHCSRLDPCYQDYRTDPADDCLGKVEERAWSSPIFVDYRR